MRLVCDEGGPLGVEDQAGGLSLSGEGDLDGPICDPVDVTICGDGINVAG